MVVLPQNLYISAGTLIEGFESATDWTGTGGTLAADTTHVKEGTQSLAFTADATARTRDKVVNLDLSTVNLFGLWLYVDDITKLAACTLYTSSVTDWSKYATWSPWGAGTKWLLQKQTGWNYVTFKRADFAASGGESFDAPVIRLRLRVQATAGNTVTVSWDGLVKEPQFTPVFLLSFDDGSDTIYDIAYPYLASKGYKATAYVISSLIDTATRLTSTELGTLAASGWDIGNHSSTPDVFTGLTQEQIETNIAACNTALDGWGVGDAKLHLAYPQGLRDADSDAAMAAQGMLTGRLAADSTYGFHMPSINNWHIMPVLSALDSTLTLAAAKTLVDGVLTDKSVGCFYGHALGATASTTQWVTQDFYDLIDYIVATGAPCLTVSQLNTLRTESVEYGGTTVKEMSPLTLTLISKH